MSQHPFVSIILPTYNRSALLPRAIQCVLDQTYQNWELIIWDDGSTDNTLEYLNSLNDPRIKYYRNAENKGIGYTRHHAVGACKGELLAFIDSDDEWFPEKLKYQAGVFEEFNELDFLICNFYNHNLIEKTNFEGFSQNKAGLDKLETSLLSEPKQLFEIIKGMPEALLKSNFISPCACLVKRAIILEAGNFNINLSGPEDFEMWWRLGLKNINWGLSYNIVSKRNKNEQSVTNNLGKIYIQNLRAVDICIYESDKNHHGDLVKLLINQKHKIWRGLIYHHAKNGQRLKALKAFAQSCRFGFSIRAIYFLIGALLGPRLIKVLKNL